jgi:uncharacterized membrane protein
MKRAMWHRHPAVRSGSDLTFGERSADTLKHVFGSWGFLLTLVGGIVAWIGWNKLAPAAWHWDTSELLLLNLCLSIMAGLQGGALQIASNRGDRISSELAVSTHQMLGQNNTLTQQVHDLTKTIATQTAVLDEIHRHVSALAPQAGDFVPGKEKP